MKTTESRGSRGSPVSRRKVITQLGLASALVVPALLGLSGPVFAADPAPSATPAPVPQTANVEVMILHATNVAGKPTQIDPKVDEGKPATPVENLPSHKLKGPGLNSYNNYLFKDRKKLLLAKGTPQHVVLPNGRTLEVSVVNVVQDRNERRVTVAASISPPSGDRYMKLIEFTAGVHQSVFVGGIAFPTGSLVVALTVEPFST